MENETSSSRDTEKILPTKPSKMPKMSFMTFPESIYDFDGGDENLERHHSKEEEHPLLLSNSFISEPGGHDSLGNEFPNYSLESHEALQLVYSTQKVGKIWHDLLKNKMLVNADFTDWMKSYPEFAEGNISKFIVNLLYKHCISKYTGCDPQTASVENKIEDAKRIVFNSKKVLALFEVVRTLVKKSDRKKFVEFVCQEGEVLILELICKQESKDKRVKKNFTQSFPWMGEFTGFETLVDLLLYILKRNISSWIVTCIAKNVYGCFHNVQIGRKYIEYYEILCMVAQLNQPDSKMKECLKTAIELGHDNVVSVMISGDIFQCIRLMKTEMFFQEKAFREAFEAIRKTVAKVISSLLMEVGRSCKDEVDILLEKGVEVDVNEIKVQYLIEELEYQEIKLLAADKQNKIKLMEKFTMHVGGKPKVKLRKTIVGALISTLYFHYQDELPVLKDKTPFKLSSPVSDKISRRYEISELVKNIDNEKFVQHSVLKFIQSLNMNNHLKNNWFFRELLENVVNDNWEKLKAVCFIICKEPVQELIEKESINTEVADVLKLLSF